MINDCKICKLEILQLIGKWNLWIRKWWNCLMNRHKYFELNSWILEIASYNYSFFICIIFIIIFEVPHLILHFVDMKFSRMRWKNRATASTSFSIPHGINPHCSFSKTRVFVRIFYINIMSRILIFFSSKIIENLYGCVKFKCESKFEQYIIFNGIMWSICMVHNKQDIIIIKIAFFYILVCWMKTIYNWKQQIIWLNFKVMKVHFKNIF